MTDPIEAARQSELEVARLTAEFIATTSHRNALSIGAPRPRQPTLFERYRSEARGDVGFGAWLKKQGLVPA